MRKKREIIRLGFIIALVMPLCLCMSAQVDTLRIEGEVTYVTTRNTYVRFDNTDQLNVGDSLYVKKGAQWTAVLKIEQKSSISCVTSGQKLAKGESVVAFKMMPRKSDVISEVEQAPISVVTDQNITLDTLLQQSQPLDTVDRQQFYKQKIRGRLSLTDQMAFEDNWLQTNQRFRGTFSLNAHHIANTGFSFQTYLIYRYNMNNLSESNPTQDQTFRLLNASLTYDWKDKMTWSLGRRINNRIANVGAIDGLQSAYRMGNWEIGGVVGSRPSIGEYSYDPGLFEYGGYAAHTLKKGAKRVMENTFAYFEQRNGGAIDRRFAYFQHQSFPTRELSIFSSFELDMYQKIGDAVDLSPRLSSLFISLRYRFSRSFSVYAAYDARRNIIFFETNKLLVDQLIDEALREGYRLRFNWRIWKNISWGTSGALRFKRNDPFQSINAHSYINISRIPWIKASLNLSVNYLSSSFSTGNIYAARLSRGFFKGRLSTTLQYRRASYTFGRSEFLQDIFGANLNFRLFKKLSLGLNYEGAFSDSRTNQRLHINLIQRF